MNRPNCGAEIDKHGKFCSNCGQKLDVVNVEDSPENTPIEANVSDEDAAPEEDALVN